ncbi:hypothetical protein [Prauserella muralis]|uniref:Uncharacterized protein n=1 Tax=Prauserella muralis TaxID=588067 RepID=A0A2V4AHU3_9PSEU|nr:hypothetical protein [Prauserella muralis]PXY19478.1 hypothetical protein BAY60_32580 [Prauserella muralis]TWE29455.1 hypothetical protein FHX69_2140 [Prauserella muralis]
MSTPRPPISESEPRTVGPELVWAGRAGDPVVLVLDPAGEAKHDDVPPTWESIAERHHVGWCRVPVEGALTAAEDLLGDPDGLGTPFDLVTSGPAEFETLDIAARHATTVRSVLLVDPVSPERGPAMTRKRELEDAGVVVTVAARSFDGARDRIGPPLPLGHPDAAAGVRRALDDLDATSPAGD